jgi:hypothetical protein
VGERGHSPLSLLPQHAAEKGKSLRRRLGWWHRCARRTIPRIVRSTTFTWGFGAPYRVRLLSTSAIVELGPVQ